MFKFILILIILHTLSLIFVLVLILIAGPSVYRRVGRRSAEMKRPPLIYISGCR